MSLTLSLQAMDGLYNSIKRPRGQFAGPNKSCEALGETSVPRKRTGGRTSLRLNGPPRQYRPNPALALAECLNRRIISHQNRFPRQRTLTMSLVLNSYLSDKSLKIRSKAIPWDVS